MSADSSPPAGDAAIAAVEEEPENLLDLFGEESDADDAGDHSANAAGATTSSADAADVAAMPPPPPPPPQTVAAIDDDDDADLFGDMSDNDEQDAADAAAAAAAAADAAAAAAAADADADAAERAQQTHRGPQKQKGFKPASVKTALSAAGKPYKVRLPAAEAAIQERIYMARLPNILGIESDEFDATTYSVEEERIVDGKLVKRQPDNVVRWRYKQGVDADGKQTLQRETNARIVRWSDGSQHLHLGNEVYTLSVGGRGGYACSP
jgi:hypothetical protein